MNMRMQETFHHAWHAVGAQGESQPVLDDLIARYAEPHRAYHTLTHILDCLEVFEGVRDLSAHPDHITLALWFHDAIYDSRGSDNEAASALLAVDRLLQASVSRKVTEAVHALIMATAHGAPEAQSPEGDVALLVDIDLSILGREPDVFDTYEAAVRREYAFVPAPVFRHHRGVLLAHFLEQPALFHTPVLKARYEVRARENLRRSVARLGDESRPILGDSEV